MLKRTRSTKSQKAENVTPAWHVVDAANQSLGRVATSVATLLQGKHKPTYVDYLDMGDHVVVINAGKTMLTGRKWDQKTYSSYSGYPGGMKERTAKQVFEKDPTLLMRQAVSRMLPKNKQRDVRMTRLHIYATETHPHTQEVA
jgi:large subunit ribosomal protein L13